MKIQEEKLRSNLMQMRVVQLQVQNEELMSSPKRQATVGPHCEKILFSLREDVVWWKRDRQLDMQDARVVPSCGECSGGFVTDIKSVSGREP